MAKKSAELVAADKHLEEKLGPQGSVKRNAESPTFRAVSDGKVSSGRSISAQDAGVVADRITSLWHRDTPKVHLAPAFSSLPKEVQDSVEKNEQEKTKGVYHPKTNTIWVILSKHATARDLEETLYHEGAHFGTLTELGGNAMAKLTRAFDKLGGIVGLMAMTKKYGFDKELKSYRDEFLKNSSQADAKAKLVAETLAMVAQKLPYQSWPAKVITAVKEMVGAIRSWLKANGFVNLSQLGETDVLHLISRGNKRLMSGGKNVAGLPSFLSKLSQEIQDSLERSGFAATHDSPILHAGKFDWRVHKGKDSDRGGRAGHPHRRAGVHPR